MKGYLNDGLVNADKLEVKEYEKWEYFDCFDNPKLMCHYIC